MTSVLVVCTANVCRSPMAEALLRAEAERRGLAIEVGSAGVAGYAGDPPSEGSVRALALRGLDIAGHRSRPASHHLVDGADLVVTMQVAHVRELVGEDPDRFGRVFTLRELVGRAATVGPRDDRPLADWLTDIGAGRRTADVFAARDLDVADPIGRPDAEYRRCGDELEALCATLARLLWGPEPIT